MSFNPKSAFIAWSTSYTECPTHSSRAHIHSVYSSCNHCHPGIAHSVHSSIDEMALFFLTYRNTFRTRNPTNRTETRKESRVHCFATSSLILLKVIKSTTLQTTPLPLPISANSLNFLPHHHPINQS
jgi:hypothetical protein